jgi:hypothetical protein
LQVQSFIKARQLIEATVTNPSLSVKFSQTCVASLRNKPLYDLIECRRHITEIYTHLIFVLIKPSILKLLILLINGLYLHCVIEKISSFDIITIGHALINCATSIRRHDIDTFARTTFFYMQNYCMKLHMLLWLK